MRTLRLARRDEITVISNGRRRTINSEEPMGNPTRSKPSGGGEPSRVKPATPNAPQDANRPEEGSPEVPVETKMQIDYIEEPLEEAVPAIDPAAPNAGTTINPQGTSAGMGQG
jgi:hypothetical protein